eukprot:TRINITY_DN7478_c0_g1_i1.p1 TRINITY_DN7478_c0_g1~~TRINITY_DN7478_c0_g1_i1.p1  ORF type:complete len:624 (+),score=124.63 TRINITY_DN7478_c0_g1_i1:58-1929(+)
MSHFSLLEKSTRIPLHVQRFEVDIQVQGFLAETTILMKFLNTLDEYKANLEGELTFSLEENSVISGFSTDVYGTLVDGVVIHRKTAQVAFENAKRAKKEGRIATIEHVIGNVFRARVFPIPKEGRIVQIKYIHHVANGFMTIPMSWCHYNIEKLCVTSSVFTSLQDCDTPSLYVNYNTAQLDEHKTENGMKFFGKYDGENSLNTTDIKLYVPSTLQQGEMIYKTPDGYFVSFNSEIPSDRMKKPSLYTINKSISIGIIWDSSKSRDLATYCKEFDLLEEIFSAYETVDLHVYCLRNELEFLQNSRIRDLNEFKKVIGSLEYDGATNLGCLTELNQPNISYYLLFSDGISTIGKRPDNSHSYIAPIYSICSSEKADHATLKIISKKSGGVYFNLHGTSCIKQISGSITDSPFRYISTSHNVEEYDVEIYPSIPTVIVGRNINYIFKVNCEKERREPTLNMLYGHENNIFQMSYKFHLEDFTPTDLLCKYWAMKKLEEAKILDSMNDDDILLLGRKYGIVTSVTSMIVLDSLSQYLLYKIEPPKTFPFYLQYSEIASRIVEDEENELNKRMNNVLSMWCWRLSWWESYPQSEVALKQALYHTNFFSDKGNKNEVERISLLVTYFE